MSRRHRRGARMEMTSLMDVMFLVLVFFIYCIFDMTVHKGLKVNLPEVAGADEKGERIVVTIAADDSLSFNGIPVTREEVLERVKGLRDVQADIPVLISGDKDASLGVGIGLLSDIKSAGVEKASFQVSGKEP
ncbi:MAG: biopolymer transporter ExbD [Kiritimatiellae bacterium]|nr:biopolymer transporter ExbD [Kiritimatiellia bacterium]